MPRKKIVVLRKKAKVGDRVAVISSENTVRVGKLLENQIKYDDGTKEIVFKLIGPISK